MSIMDKVRNKMQSWLQINPPAAMMINIQDWLDYNGNAIKNRIWYRGEAAELEQLYMQIPKHAVEMQKFWASHATPGLDMRKIHTGLPAVMVNVIAGIIASNLNDITLKEGGEVRNVWDTIADENDLKTIIEKSISETLVIGDGAYKISLDPDISEYPVIEWWAGDSVEYRTKRGRVQEVVFKSERESDFGTLELKEIYGKGYVDYELYKGGEPVALDIDPQFAGLVRTEWDNDTMLAVPLKFYSSAKWDNRGQSVYDRKIDAFDSLDEAYSQWIDALRSGRTKEYIPETLLPRDPKTGAVLKPNPFDNRYIRTDADMREGAESKIQSESGTIEYASYAATYAAALDLCLQGVLSPSTLGVDVKKLDNAEAQREKEKVTLYTRDAIIEKLQPALIKLVEVALAAFYTKNGNAIPEMDVIVSFQDYANPSFESQIETVSKGRAQGVLSVEAAVEELYGDDKPIEWKAEEVERIKIENNIPRGEKNESLPEEQTVSNE